MYRHMLTLDNFKYRTILRDKEAKHHCSQNTRAQHTLALLPSTGLPQLTHPLSDSHKLGQQTLGS